MSPSRPGPAEASFTLGMALLLGQATAGPDDPFESARGAFISAMSAKDPEWSPRAAYILAHALLDRRDLAGARQYATVAQQSKHPEWSTGGLLVQAHVHALERRQEPAMQAFRQVIGTGQPRFVPSAWYNLGTLHQQREQWSEAADAYDRAVSTGDAEFAPKAATNLGFVRANYLNDPAGARRAFAVAVASDDAEQAALAQGNLHALDELERLSHTQTPVPPPLENSTDVSVDQGGDRKKLRWWVFGKPKSPADELLKLGERLEKRQDLRGAEDAYRKADAAGSAEAASNLGVLLFERGAVEEAHAVLTRADERGSGTGAFRLGFLLEETGRVAEAEAAYQRAVARGNQNAAGNLAALHERRGGAGGSNPALAIAAEAVGRGTPTFQVSSGEDALIGMATVEHEQGRSDRAEEILRQVVALPGRKRGLAALNLGILREARGDRDGARSAYAEAVASDDRSSAGAAALNLALMSAAQGDYPEAERLLRIAAKSDHPEARVSGALNLGIALELRGANSEARRWFERVVKSKHPEYAPVAMARMLKRP